MADAMVRRPKVFGGDITVGQLREFFRDDHVHMALLVDREELVTAVERSDLVRSHADDDPARSVGSLVGRTTEPTADLQDTMRRMLATARRRLVVVDGRGGLLGLLCLKRSGRGFCSDRDVAERRCG